MESLHVYQSLICLTTLWEVNTGLAMKFNIAYIFSNAIIESSFTKFTTTRTVGPLEVTCTLTFSLTI